MPANELSLRVYFMGRFHSKGIFQKCVFFTNIENGFSSKIKKTTTQISTYYLFLHKIKIRSASHNSSNCKFIIPTPSQTKGKFLCLL